jgi:signal transduction histidine kinase
VAAGRASADVERDDFHVLPRPTSVAALLAELAAYARTLPQTHAITIAPAPDTVVDVDPDRVGQVVRNLLTNAVRHTPAGTPITVHATPADGRVTFEVTDRGPGIAPEDQARIFEKFGRGRDATRQATPGRGLGLYLSRRILQAHGSDLRVTSTPGQGTAFHFTLEEAR